MKTGGTRRLLIPAQYAYGSQSVAGIPPNSDLVFDITLLSVK
jgi:FKBP-type peptidyl-prolyl cis-trans isomerase